MSYHSTPTRPNSRAGTRYKDTALLMAQAGVSHFAYVPDHLPVREGQRVRWLDWQTQTYQTGTVRPGTSIIAGVCRVSVHLDGKPDNQTNQINVEQLEVVASKIIPINALSIEEQHALAEREAVIEKGFTVFLEVGKALLDIRDQRLYRALYKTFEEYLQKRWDISRTRGYQIINSAKIAGELSTTVDIDGMKERHARELNRFPQDLRPAIWQTTKAYSESTKEPFTAKMVGRVGNVILEAATTGCVDVGDGNSTPLLAALTKEQEEARKRQITYIKERQEKKPVTLPFERVAEWINTQDIATLRKTQALINARISKLEAANGKA